MKDWTCKIENIPIYVDIRHGHLPIEARVERSQSSVEKIDVTIEVQIRHEKTIDSKNIENFWNYSKTTNRLREMQKIVLTDALENLAETILRSISEEIQTIKAIKKSVRVSLMRSELIPGTPVKIEVYDEM